VAARLTLAFRPPVAHNSGMSPDADATVTSPPPAASDTATLPPGAAAPPPPPAPTFATVPGYQLVKELGRGGMGVVYLATQDGLNRQVALKMVLAGAHASEKEKARFLVEAEAVAAVRHPGVVQVFDFGTHDGRPYFALEYLSGGCLGSRLDGTPMPPRTAARLVQQIATAVQAAHDAGVVHRDLKPANILFDADGKPKVTDFGLAKRVGSESGLTQTGAVMGTPSYMAPEQAEGKKEVGPAADVYAVGAILYECLTGRPPFRAATPLDTLLQVMSAEPVPPRQLNPQTPADLETVALKCLSKDPRRRYPSAAAVADDLRRYQSGEPIVARPVSLAERGWRWLKKNPLLAAVVVGGPLLLSGTVVIVLAALLLTAVANVRLAAETLKAENDRKEAELQRMIAHERLEKAIEAIDKMLVRAGSERWAGSPEMQEERRQVLEDAVAFYQGFTGEDSKDPQVRKEGAKAYTRLAAAYLMLGDLEKTTTAAAEAGRLYDGLMAEFPNEAEHFAAAAEAHSLAGNSAALRAQYADALREYTRAVGLADTARGMRGDSAAYKLRAVEARAALGYFYLQDDRAKGEQLVATLLELAREVGGPADAGYEYRSALAFALTVGAAYDLARGDPKAAAAKYDESAAVLATLAGKPAPTTHARTQVALSRAIVGVQRGFILTLSPTADRKREGAKQMRAGIALFDELLRVNAKAFPYQLQKFQALRTLAGVYTALNEPAEAAPLAAAADRLMATMIADNPNLAWLAGLDAFRDSVKLVERVRADDTFAFEAEADRLLGLARPRRNWDVVYNVACGYAVAAGKRTPADKHAGKAVALLNELADTLYFRARPKVDRLGTDPDLVPLHTRPDYQQFVAKVKNAPADPPKPK
jgi:predicted Ser/Thr protein kinase/tetratricopeptide (TPR) repeat protein